MPKTKPRQHHPTESSLIPDPQQSQIDQTQQQQLAFYDQASQTHYQTRTTASLNLTVLQRHNPSITQILSIAHFAVVYTFSPSTAADKQPGWEKTGVEGTLFVIALNHNDGLERYGVIVLNRKGLENFQTELERPEDVELSGEFVILQRQGTEAVEITGLWIFASEEGGDANGNGKDVRELVAGVIVECAGWAEASPRKMEEGKAGAEGARGAADGKISHETVAQDGGGGTDILQTLFAGARSGQGG